MQQEDLQQALQQLEETATHLEEQLNARKAKAVGPLREKRERLRAEHALLAAQNEKRLAECEQLEWRARHAGSSPRLELVLRALPWILIIGGLLSLMLTGRPVSGEVGLGFLTAALMVAFALPRLR
jgi:hypothetical protein